MRFALALLKQVSQTAACNRNHHVGERLARWLLTCHDRVNGDELKLTQEFIAEMLGTRRSGVSEAGDDAAIERIDPLLTRKHYDSRSKRTGKIRLRVLCNR